MKEASFLTHPDDLRGVQHGETGVERLANLVPRRDRSGKGYYQCPATFTPFQIEGSVFPFPQIVRGMRRTFILTANRLGYLDESVGSGSWFPFVGVTLTGAWSVADFGDNWVIMNPSYTALCSLSAPGNPQYLYPDSGFDCCCAYGTRLVCARNSDKTVHWGSPHGDDLEVMLGVAGATRSLSQENRKDYNSLPYLFQGDALALRLIGDRIVVYGEDGIMILARDNINGFSPVWAAGIPANLGLHSAMAVTGGQDGHIFIGSDGMLYSLTPDGQCNRIGKGYREFVSALTDPVLSPHPEHRDG